MRIDPKSHIPVYLQIVESVRSSIAAGVFLPGEIVPSVRVLALELQVNPNTVQRAYEELERREVIESRRGVGKFVSQKGNRSAVTQSEVAVRNDFSRGIEIAKAADLPVKRIRILFDECLAEASTKARAAK